jgi:hypothetical protein
MILRRECWVLCGMNQRASLDYLSTARARRWSADVVGPFSLEKMLATCFCVAPSEMMRLLAMAELVRPSAMSATTFCSRLLRTPVWRCDERHEAAPQYPAYPDAPARHRGAARRYVGGA